MEKYLIYLQEHDEEELCDKLDSLYENIGFSNAETTFEEISEVLKVCSDIFAI